MDKIIQQFEDYLKTTNYTKNTCINYYSRIKEFSQEVTVNNISKESIDNFFVKYKENRSPETLTVKRLSLWVAQCASRYRST